jgi:hypothetical protein
MQMVPLASRLLRRLLTSTVIFEVVDAALRHPALLPVVWGPGWKGWDASQSVSANINGKWGGCGYFDVMWTFAWLLKSASPRHSSGICRPAGRQMSDALLGGLTESRTIDHLLRATLAPQRRTRSWTHRAAGRSSSTSSATVTTGRLTARACRFAAEALARI